MLESQMAMPKLQLYLFRLVVWLLILGAAFPGTAQDIAALSMRARVNLYDNWNFDSVAYYHDQVIGKKYCPAFAYSDYGWYLLLKGENSKGMSMIRKAADMAPSDTQLTTWYAWALLWDNKPAKAREWIEKALSNDPSNGEALFVASLIASEQDDHSRAVDYARSAASMDPMWRASGPLALAAAGKHAEATDMAKSIALSANANDAMLLAEMYVILGDRKQALGFLEKSYELKHPFMPWIECWPGMRPLYGEPRFQDLVDRMNLPQ